MNKSELTAFGKLWGGMAEVYGKSVSDAVIAMAFSALEKYELIDVRRAINAHVANPERGQFIAKPADLILHIEGDPESRSLQAWTQVVGSIKRVGPYPSVVFDDPLVMVALSDMGGWVKLCEATEHNLPFIQQEFVRRYRGYINKPPSAHPPMLIGISDSHNLQHVQNHKPDPVLLGNTERALQIMRTGGERKETVVSLSQILDRLKLEQKSPEV